MSVRYGRGIRNGGHTAAPDGFTDAQWHQDAMGDTGTSHTMPGRLYVVQCEWCPAAFAARTRDEALSMFREHEYERLAADREEKP